VAVHLKQEDTTCVIVTGTVGAKDANVGDVRRSAATGARASSTVIATATATAGTDAAAA
jgi:hypothetical protein